MYVRIYFISSSFHFDSLSERRVHSISSCFIIFFLLWRSYCFLYQIHISTLCTFCIARARHHISTTARRYNCQAFCFDYHCIIVLVSMPFKRSKRKHNFLFMYIYIYILKKMLFVMARACV